MEKFIDNLKSKSLSNNDIMKMCDKKVNIYTYPELTKFKNVDDLLHPWGACIILYMTTDNFGHWVALIKINGTNIIEHFDSYGYKPDEELKFIPKYFRKESKQMKPHLTCLLYKSPYQISYNEHRLQKKEDDVNTCGRFAAFRVIMKHLSLNEFVELFKNKYLDPDSIISLISGFI